MLRLCTPECQGCFCSVGLPVDFWILEDRGACWCVVRLVFMDPKINNYLCSDVFVCVSSGQLRAFTHPCRVGGGISGCPLASRHSFHQT